MIYIQTTFNDYQLLKKKIILTKEKLEPSSNLKETFKLINQHLYGKLKHTDTGTRARSKQIIYLLFCKLHDEVNSVDDKELEFQIKGDNPDELLKRIQVYFNQHIKYEFRRLIDQSEFIELNKELVYLIVEKLQNISLLKSSQDIINDAFEVFVSRKLKEDGGQFFTPVSVIEFMVNFLNPEIDSKIIDPACGHGGFLLKIIDLLWQEIDKNLKSSEEVKSDKKRSIISNLYGIDKDLSLAKISKIYIEILTRGKCNIFCEDSLDPNSYQLNVKKVIKDNKFDYVLTNPPFGSKIPIEDKKVLENYNLGYAWTYTKQEKWENEKKLVERQPPQILFIERCIQLLKDGGKLGIILPEGIFGNPSDRYIWQYLKKQGKILGIVSLDQNTFQPYTSNKTSILFFEKTSKVPKDYKIILSKVDYVGHDKDGKILYKLKKDGSCLRDPDTNQPIINNELKDLHFRMKNSEDFNYLKEQKLFKINLSQIKNDIYIPNYYLGVERTLKKLGSNDKFKLITIRDLIKKNIIYTNNNGYIPRGDEIGSKVYGLGEIPFIRTSEIFNWEVNLDANKKTSEEVFSKYRDKQNIEEGDILIVKDGGSNLIGKVAYISELDTKIIIQSHIYQIKILKNNELIDPYLMLYLLNFDIVQKQIQAITFIQGTIATIGNRILDIILPLPKDVNERKQISNYIKDIIINKTGIRRKLHGLSLKTFFQN